MHNAFTVSNLVKVSSITLGKLMVSCRIKMYCAIPNKLLKMIQTNKKKRMKLFAAELAMSSTLRNNP